jgi:hypothetical protein
MAETKPNGKPSVDGPVVEPVPGKFLEVRVQQLDVNPSLIALCAGYEGGQWRSQQLVEHMMEWLPEFALTYEERRSLGTANAVRRMRQAARSIYSTKKFRKRGEFGELLLHIAIRQVFETLPAISKIYYKDSRNDTVKGFDAVHVVADTNGLELWLGEAKFYDDIHRAIAEVLKDLASHTEVGFLRAEFAAITNKIDPRWPYAEKLKALLDPAVSLDQIFSVACIPVLLTYDSAVVGKFSQICTEYQREFALEVCRTHQAFCAKQLPKIRIHLFLVPLKSKAELVQALDEGLKAWQQI